MARKRADKPILLVGAVNMDTANDVFDLIGTTIGGLPLGYPDGETDERQGYVSFVAARVLEGHPDITTVTRPIKEPGKPDWMPKTYKDMFHFTIAPGKDKIKLDNLVYGDVAIASYRTFKAKRDQGVLPRDARFQISIPIPEDGVRGWAHTPHDEKIMRDAYAAALPAEIAKICAAIPHRDLVIQWDVAWVTLAIDCDDIVPNSPLNFRPFGGTPMERYLGQTNAILREIPNDVITGIHLCYGDFNHRHFVEPKDLAVVVDMMNRSVAAAPRSIDYFHVPVPRDRTDDAYFAPLKNLAIGDTKLYIGLIHHTDGIEGTLKRLATAKKYIQDFGIATECGLGRRPRETLPALLEIHKRAAAAL